MNNKWKKGPTKWELILLFERNRLLKPYDIWKKLTPRYSKATIYRYYRKWKEADMIVQVIGRDLYKAK
jgi:Fe2+ or Zn2+ uptake regulation protein